MNPDPVEYWNVVQTYFGVVDTEYVICSTTNFVDACSIVDALLLFHKGRPFAYQIVYAGNVYYSGRDALQEYDFVENAKSYLEKKYAL